jgi:hypothetical protein
MIHGLHFYKALRPFFSEEIANVPSSETMKAAFKIKKNILVKKLLRFYILVLNYIYVCSFQTAKNSTHNTMFVLHTFEAVTAYLLRGSNPGTSLDK